MKYRTPEEVFGLVTKAAYPPELRPLLQRLEWAGAFSNRLAGLVDRIQEDEGFRHKLISDQKAVQELGKANRLEGHELFALVAAAQLLDPAFTWPVNELSFAVAPSPENLAEEYKRQSLDIASLRKEKVEQLTERILHDPQYLQLVVEQPVLALGTSGLNRIEFFVVYLQAATLQMAKRGDARMNISSDFVKIIGLGESELRQAIATYFTNKKKMTLTPYDNARRHLRELQEAEGVPPRSASAQEMQRMLRSTNWTELSFGPESLDEAIRLGNLVGGMDGFLRHLADQTLEILPSGYTDILRPVPIGMLNTYHPYGEMRDAPGGGQFIVFHRGLFVFIHDMSRVIVAGTMLVPTQSRDRGGLLLVTLARKALHISLLFLADVQMKGTHFVELTPEADLHADLSRRLVERFCILHEYAHVLQQRSESGLAPILENAPLDGSELTGMSAKQAAECRADAWAARVMACRVHPVFDQLPGADQWRLAAPGLFFVMVYFLEKVLASADDIQRGMNIAGLPIHVDLSEYPPVSQRFGLVRRLLRGNDEKTHASGEIVDAGWELMGLLWDICQAGLSQGVYRDLSRHDRRG